MTGPAAPRPMNRYSMRMALQSFPKALIVAFGLCLALPTGAERRPPHARQGQPSLAVCKAFLGAVVSGDMTDAQAEVAQRREDRRERQAERVLSRFSRNMLRRCLQPYLKRLRPGSEGYTGVAYALAFFGIDPAKNVGRMTVCLNNSSYSEFVYVIPERIDRVYRRQTSDAVLREYLTVRGDGAIEEDLVSLRGSVFIHSPCRVLRVAATRYATLDELADTLLFESDGEDSPHMARPIRSTLRHIAASGDFTAANAARFCLHYIMREMRANDRR